MHVLPPLPPRWLPPSPVSPVTPVTTTEAVSPKTQDVSTVSNGGEEHQLTLRSLVSTKEAGIIIGKGGATIASIRNSTGVKAGVSKVVPGVQDRVFSATGEVEAIAAAYGEIARLLLETPLSDSSLPPPPVGAFTSVRLLISHNLMGTVIGRSGLKIKQIQDASGARMVASKEMLPQSTERVVEVQGAVEAIKTAVLEIAKCLLEDWDRGQGTVQYHPGAGGDAGVLAGGLGAQTVTGPTGGIRRTSLAAGSFGAPAGFAGERRASRPSISLGSGESRRGSEAPLPNDPNLRTQNISIPSDMVGCIIGRGGSKITEIRRLSGSRISIAKVPHDETGERMFTIVGTPESTERALMLLYSQLESEKERRVNQGAEVGEVA
ncbi:putative cytoplasm protein [Papiliotrema laurentii]|uniref:Cytoplasm protein n=1 Tax=Papiliotrema laurentii TaxID=5418 RepID=A0AAD9FSS7_PAPLA|nr:putative cytoplasm protein [Papiliotrema laurentii]